MCVGDVVDGLLVVVTVCDIEELSTFFQSEYRCVWRVSHREKFEQSQFRRRFRSFCRIRRKHPNTRNLGKVLYEKLGLTEVM